MAGKGGKRPGAGRPKKRIINQDVAGRILERVKAEDLWVEVVQKARKARNTAELQTALRYLEDRHYGRPHESVAVNARVALTPGARLERVAALVQKLTGKAGRE